MQRRVHRVPYVLGTTLSQTGAVDTLLEGAFRNDTGWPLEIYGFGFSLGGSVASVANQNLGELGLMFDAGRVAWGRQGMYPPIATLVDLAGNSSGAAPGGADIFTFHGSRWSLRHPTVLRAGEQIVIGVLRIPASGTYAIDVSAIGALLTDVPDDARLSPIASRWDRAQPWTGALPPELAPRPFPFGLTPPRGWQVPAGELYEYAPYVLTSQQTLTASGLAIFPEADLRNTTQYDWVVHAVGMFTDGSLDGSPGQGPRDVNIHVYDLGARWPWSRLSHRFAALADYAGSIMGVGQGGVWTATKWNVGPGALVPPGAGLRITGANNLSESVTARISAIGELAIPVGANECRAPFDSMARAVPTRW